METACFLAFKKSINDNEGIPLQDGVDYSVSLTGTITFGGEYHKELKRDWVVWVNSWYTAILYLNRAK